MNASHWGVWIGYVVIAAVAAFIKTAFWWRRRPRVTPSKLESWVGLLLLGFFCAFGLGQWLGADFLASFVAFGVASALITGAAVNAAYRVGLHEGERMLGNEAEKYPGV
jgi:hypothetical protein